MEAEVSEDGSAGEEGAAHAGEEMPVCPICRTVRLRHVVGLFYYLTVDLEKKRKMGFLYKSLLQHHFCH